MLLGNKDVVRILSLRIDQIQFILASLPTGLLFLNCIKIYEYESFINLDIFGGYLDRNSGTPDVSRQPEKLTFTILF